MAVKLNAEHFPPIEIEGDEIRITFPLAGEGLTISLYKDEQFLLSQSVDGEIGPGRSIIISGIKVAMSIKAV